MSATFLIKNNSTLEDRGWQLVRIEDTAWTTAFANPYTVSIEYEHNGRDPIPGIAYYVIAQTWIDIAEHVRQHNLGTITLDRAGIRGHKEWVNNPALICPDGIEVDRIVREIESILNVQPDPNALLLPGNPFGEVPVMLGFKGLYLDTGKAKYPNDPLAGGLSLWGYPERPEESTSYGSRQVFERAIFRYEAGKQRPWDLVIQHRRDVEAA